MIRVLLHAYMFLLVLDAVLSYIPSLRTNALVRRLKTLANFSLDPIRRFLPRELPVDLSPLIAIILIQLVIELW